MRQRKRIAVVLSLTVTCAVVALSFFGDHLDAYLEGITPNQAKELRLFENKLTQAHPFSEVLALHLESDEGRQVIVTLEPEVAATADQQTAWSRTAAVMVATETDLGVNLDRVVVIITHAAGSNDLGDDLFIATHQVATLRQQAGLSQSIISADLE